MSTYGVPETEVSSQTCGAGQLLRSWVEQVSEFGMSGRCQSLTALFHFGYTLWSACKRGVCVGDGSLPAGGEMPAKIAEEEERTKDEFCEDIRMMPEFQEPACIAFSGASSAAAASACSSELKDGQFVTRLLMAAQKAADSEQYQQALELCAEALATVTGVHESSSWSSTSSVVPSLPSAACAPRERRPSSSGSALPLNEEGALAVQQILLLRASIQVTLRKFNLALQDAEKLISLQPTCAEGYYYQSVALQGMDRGQEALEALMAALEYDPQNSLFQHTFTSLFEDISSSANPAVAPPAAPPVLHGRRSRRDQLGDALSMTTQATHLSSRSTTPTEVSAPQSRSSSHDSMYINEATTGDAPT